MTVYFNNSLPPSSISFDGALSFLEALNQRVVLVALAAITGLIASFLLVRYCVKTYKKLKSKPPSLPKQPRPPQQPSPPKKLAEKKSTPDNSLRETAWELAQQEKYHEALFYSEKHLKIYPEDLDGLLLHGGIHKLLGKLEEATASFEKALTLHPQDDVALNFYAQTFNRQDAHDLEFYGIALMKQLKYKEAAAIFRELLKINPKILKAHAFCLARDQKVLKAVLNFQEADKLAPLEPCFLIIYAGLLHDLNLFDHAAANYQEALKREPQNAEALRGYAETLHLQGKLNEAAAQFEKSFKLEADHLLALRNYGDTLRELGRFEEAIVQFEKVLKKDPDDRFALLAHAKAKQQDKRSFRLTNP